MQGSPRKMPTGLDSHSASISARITGLRQCPVAGSKPSSSGGGQAANSTTSELDGPTPTSYGTPR
jgi:hypothetical protein